MEIHERSTCQQGWAGWRTKTCHCCRWPTLFEGNHTCFVVDTCIQCDRLLKEATVNILASITAITQHQTPTDFLHVPRCSSNASYKAVLLAKSRLVAVHVKPFVPFESVPHCTSGCSRSEWSRVCNDLRTHKREKSWRSQRNSEACTLSPLSYVQSSTKHTHVEQSFPARMFILAPALPVTYLILLVLCVTIYPSLIFIMLFHSFFVCELRGRNKESTRIGASLTVVRDPVQTPFVYKDMPEQYFFYSSVLTHERSRQHHSKICVNIFFLFLFFRETWIAFPSLRHNAYIMCIRNFCSQLCLTFVVILIFYVFLLFVLVHPAVLECRGYQLQC